MLRRMVIAAALLMPLGATAQVCAVDRAAVEARIAELEPDYSVVQSDFSCGRPGGFAQKAICASLTGADMTLWRMARLDDLAWVYAYENATGTETNRKHPPRDEDFIATRDACPDMACLCAALIQHTNDTLGGTSPYPQ